MWRKTCGTKVDSEIEGLARAAGSIAQDSAILRKGELRHSLKGRRSFGQGELRGEEREQDEGRG
jgi:hypothetical protein